MLSDSLKKLQVFVSSTYRDLLKERQAAVMAILESNHIPAGMELFAAGDKSQLEVIRNWIDESDVYLLILGGRYGSIDPESKKSYMELEYDYAIQKKKPVFACLIHEEKLNSYLNGSDLIEKENPEKLKKFRKKILKGRIIKFWKDETELKLNIMQALGSFSKQKNLRGWIKAPEADAFNEFIKSYNDFIHLDGGGHGKLSIDSHFQFMNHENAFQEVNKLIYDYIQREQPDHIDLKFMGVAMRYTITYIEKSLTKIASENPKVRFLCKLAHTNSEHLDKFNLDIAECDWAKDSRKAAQSIRQIEENYKKNCDEEKRECNLRCEISIFDEIPQRHGILLKLDQDHLFLGVSDWDMATDNPRLTVGTNRYRHHNSNQKEGRFWIDIFKHWFMFYQRYQRILKKPKENL